MSRRHNNRQNKARNTTTTFEGLEDRRMFAAGAPDWYYLSQPRSER